MSELNNFENALPLCPTCHAAFDRLADPLWIMLPSDLDFFITAEEEDQKERWDHLERTGDLPHRIVPGAGSYQARNGGLYQPYILKHHLSPGLKTDNWEERVWKGEPFAAIRKAALSLGSIRLHAVPIQVRVMLSKLWNLYLTNISADLSLPPQPQDTEKIKRTGQDSAVQQDLDSSARMRPSRSTPFKRSATAKRPPPAEPTQQSPRKKKAGQVSLTKTRTMSDGECMDAKAGLYARWGPDVTSQDKIELQLWYNRRQEAFLQLAKDMAAEEGKKYNEALQMATVVDKSLNKK